MTSRVEALDEDVGAAVRLTSWTKTAGCSESRDVSRSCDSPKPPEILEPRSSDEHPDPDRHRRRLRVDPDLDIDASIAFYGDVLGLPCSVRYDRVPGAEFEAGPLTLQIIDAKAIGRELKPHAFPIALRVADMASARAELAPRGVTFAHEFDSGVCHNAAFEDPDGNVLMLHQRYTPRVVDA